MFLSFALKKGTAKQEYRPAPKDVKINWKALIERVNFRMSWLATPSRSPKFKDVMHYLLIAFQVKDLN